MSTIDEEVKIACDRVAYSASSGSWVALGYEGGQRSVRVVANGRGVDALQSFLTETECLVVYIKFMKGELSVFGLVRWAPSGSSNTTRRVLALETQDIKQLLPYESFEMHADCLDDVAGLKETASNARGYSVQASTPKRAPLFGVLRSVLPVSLFGGTPDTGCQNVAKGTVLDRIQPIKGKEEAGEVPGLSPQEDDSARPGPSPAAHAGAPDRTPQAADPVLAEMPVPEEEDGDMPPLVPLEHEDARPGPSPVVGPADTGAADEGDHQAARREEEDGVPWPTSLVPEFGDPPGPPSFHSSDDDEETVTECQPPPVYVSDDDDDDLPDSPMSKEDMVDRVMTICACDKDTAMEAAKRGSSVEWMVNWVIRLDGRPAMPPPLISEDLVPEWTCTACSFVNRVVFSDCNFCHSTMRPAAKTQLLKEGAFLAAEIDGGNPSEAAEPPAESFDDAERRALRESEEELISQMLMDAALEREREERRLEAMKVACQTCGARHMPDALFRCVATADDWCGLHYCAKCMTKYCAYTVAEMVRDKDADEFNTERDVICPSVQCTVKISSQLSMYLPNELVKQFNQYLDRVTISLAINGCIRSNQACPVCGFYEMEVGGGGEEAAFASSSCPHWMHSGCMKELLKHSLNSSALHVTCPLCDNEFTTQDWIESLPEGDLETFYERRLGEHVHLDSNTTQCPGADCTVAVFCNPGEEGQYSFFKCPKCRDERGNPQRYCLTCRVPFHEGITCTNYQRALQEDQSEAEIQNISKPCPHCGIRVSKEDYEDGSLSCRHMTCPRCNQEWCWMCLQFYVYKDGTMLDRHTDECEAQWMDLLRERNLVD